jgi:hypothetical protein
MAKRKPVSDIGLKRRQGTKKPAEAIFIIPEGQTEVAYFKALKNQLRKPNIQIDVATANSDTDPRQLAERAIAVKKSDKGYTHIACVLDADKPEALAQAKQIIKSHKDIALYTSDPCFEVWLLLHFVQTDAPFENCHAAQLRLRSHWNDFVKGLKCPCHEIISRLLTAMNNAEKTEHQTNIPKLIELTNAVKKSYDLLGRPIWL